SGALPISASASRRTILAPPRALMPPWLLISSIAISAPICLSWPWRAQRPDSGATSAILTSSAASAGRGPTSGRARSRARTSVRMRWGTIIEGSSIFGVKRQAHRIERRQLYHARVILRRSEDPTNERARPHPPPCARHRADARPDALHPVHRGGGLRRRRHPRQPAPQPRHLRGAGPGGHAHEADVAVHRGGGSVHTARPRAA